MLQPIVIDRSTTINAIVDRHPELMPILSGHGLDLCCGGPLTLAEAADRHGIDAAALVTELAAALAAGGGPAPGAVAAPVPDAARS
ncbi:MAG: DUF542 domain-containing protein [Anaerolineae bacterium]